MDLDLALAFAARRHQGVLTTVKADGRPQLSNIAFDLSGARARISVTDTRAKTRNLRRDPRASLYVPGDDFWSYAVLEGRAELSPVTTAPGDATADELVAYYRSVRGEHPDWEEYRRSLVAEGRLVVTVRIDHAYGMINA